MREYTSSALGVIPEPESFHELLDLLLVRPSKHGNRRVWMWRGQSDATWPISSAAHRRVMLEPPFSEQMTLEDRVRFYEKGLLEQATHHGFRFHEGRELTDIELLGRLQHHGAATRLVDATRNALVALYFASSEHPDRTGSLLGVHSSFVGGCSEGEMLSDSYDALVKKLAECDYPWTWQPTAVSSRVAAQHSQFVFSKVVEASMGSLALPAGDATKVIAVSPAQKREHLVLLSELFDIRAQTLFPDVDGFGMANSVQTPTSAMYRW